MSAPYSKRFEAFLCCHEKGPKISLGAAAKYLKKSKSFVKKWNQIHLACKIREIWRSLPVQYAETLVESISRRCQAILSNNGDWTSY
ncbi:hypothetical protein ILUMI_13838 [Ignelater luminosus]|uniref:Uncharacterized protein n=1 Tax=Ignelater luminosus TaxID=2038154 RepID=A0A8K0G5F1_IGNLU|nr:hypothetical protein ILUMI_13838 [Ignelater luminosus]